MKTLARQQMSIRTEVMELLNQQVAAEAYSATLYLSMASWCQQMGYTHSSEFFYKQSEEEREHMMKIFKFINYVGGAAVAPAVKPVQQEFSSLVDVLEATLSQEIAVTQSISAIITKARSVEDYASENFLQWFVSEQLEEEAQIRGILKAIKLAEGSTLKDLDEYVK